MNEIVRHITYFCFESFLFHIVIYFTLDIAFIWRDVTRFQLYLVHSLAMKSKMLLIWTLILAVGTTVWFQSLVNSCNVSANSIFKRSQITAQRAFKKHTFSILIVNPLSYNAIFWIRHIGICMDLFWFVQLTTQTSGDFWLLTYTKCWYKTLLCPMHSWLYICMLKAKPST